MSGGGPGRREAEGPARRKGIQERVHFLGKQNEINMKLAVADLMLMPSELESFGLAALEAMACKVPSIATRVGGVPELIDHGHSGMLADVGGVEKMFDYAIELLSDDKRFKAMG